MILLDTNVIAELMKPQPSPDVVAWLNDQDSAALFLSTIALGEIGFGIEILPQGQRRNRLERGFHKVSEVFAGHILSFDEEAAKSYAVVMGRRRAIGRPLSALDGQISAIARAKGLAVATRNVRDFEDCGVKVINPFPT